ncbi:hypothetical protein [Amycolatopsis aidingensis]|nr:hypothetical protein [Amycolatopsis aidingensis]
MSASGAGFCDRTLSVAPAEVTLLLARCPRARTRTGSALADNGGRP